MINLLNLCTNSNVLTLFLFIKIVFTIICILLPIIIMYKLFRAMYLVVLSGDKISDHLFQIFKSFVASLIVFLLPSFFSYLFTNLLPSDSYFSTCFNNSTLDKINYYKEEEKKKREQEAKEYKEQLKDAMQESYEKEKDKNEELNDFFDEYKDDNDDENSDSSNNDVIPDSSNTNLKNAAKNIIIGDSRTVGMCASITGDWTKCQFNNGGSFINGDDIYIAQGSMGYSWFNNTAIAEVNRILAANPDTVYNIYSLMGVNFLLSDIDKYIPTYNSLAQGSWSNHNLILVSVNPVDEVVEAQNGYSTKNSDIITFNNKLKSGTSGNSNIKYCDTYSVVLNNLSTSDGLHYASSTYKTIYSAMKSCGN